MTVLFLLDLCQVFQLVFCRFFGTRDRNANASSKATTKNLILQVDCINLRRFALAYYDGRNVEQERRASCDHHQPTSCRSVKPKDSFIINKRQRMAAQQEAREETTTEASSKMCKVKVNKRSKKARLLTPSVVSVDKDLNNENRSKNDKAKTRDRHRVIVDHTYM